MPARRQLACGRSSWPASTGPGSGACTRCCRLSPLMPLLWGSSGKKRSFCHYFPKGVASEPELVRRARAGLLEDGAVVGHGRALAAVGAHQRESLLAGGDLPLLVGRALAGPLQDDRAVVLGL